jgi:monooxygenase
MGADVDVVVVGAGLSGIGAVYRLLESDPQRTFAVLEQRESIGGTWDIFRYPGVRSDSDMYTLSYPWRPWTNRKAIADGADIRQYIEDAADDYGIREHIRFGRKVRSANWSSDDAQWTVTSTLADGSVETITARFLFACSGYYSYEEGYTPNFEGTEDFAGQILHPQFWPENLDYSGKNVVIIGSGATAVTMLPAMAAKAAKVTMLQRSPGYVITQPLVDPFAQVVQRIFSPQRAHDIIRMRYALMTIGFYEFCRKFPKAARGLLQGYSRRAMPKLDAKSLEPRYNPWDQRLCVVPNSDLFRAVRKNKASIVTDTVDRFAKDGIVLGSGATLPADIVVTATGLQVVPLGNIELSVDGAVVKPGDTVSYRGMMLSGVPNFAWCFGYTNSSWTLRADITWKYVARFLEYLESNDYAYGLPDPQRAPQGGDTFIDLNSGYIQRVADQLPRRGTEVPWVVNQNWFRDRKDDRQTPLDQDIEFVPSFVATSS